MNELNTIMCTHKIHKSTILGFLIFYTLFTSCQQDRSNRPSPFAADSINIEGNLFYIHYSSPGVKKREIWGVLDPYDEVWRIGANEATVFHAGRDLTINDSLLLPKGKYSVFAIPREGDWTIIFNKDWDQWGSYNYDKSLDQLRFDLTPKFVNEHKERLTFTLTNNSINFHWEYLQFNIPFELR